MSSSAAAATAAVVAPDVDSTIWKAIAGSTVEVPTLGSRVYYFPEGHAEHINNNSNSNLSTATAIVSSVGLPPSLPSFFLCRVLRVQFLADPQSEQVFAKLLLFPVHWDDDDDMRNVNFSPRKMHGDGEEQVESDNGDVVSFSKILTPSDANNGGGFSVPRFCADSIFPPLDFEAEPPVQNLFIRDINGNVFEFRHIYRGTPRRHLLTTGWSKFVNAKRLVAGDSVVFMRKKGTGELFVGVRRALKGSGATTSRWNSSVVGAGAVLDQNGINSGAEVPGFWRNVKGRAVLQAMEMASKGVALEVLYYPRPGSSDFVVNAEMVEQSMNVPWNAGVRVKMSVETEDSSRMTWSHGTVLSTCVPDNGPWCGSPWRMLQIKWDEHDVLKNVTRVNPWEVVYVMATASLHSAFPPMKKMKVLQNLELLPTEEEKLLPPVRELSNSMMGYLDPLFQNYTSSPASMQGARQDQFCFPSLSNIKSEIIQPTCSDSFVNNGIKSKSKTVSTELNIGSSQSENLSPDSQSSVHYSGTELAGKVGANTPTKVGVCSFQLFGKIIHMEVPVEDGCDYIGCTEGESRKVCEDIEGINDPLDLSLTFPCSKLLDRLDVQCQRGSAVEACPL